MQNNLLQTFSKNRKLILAAFLPLSFWVGIFAFWFYGTGASSAEPIVIKSPQNKIDNSISQIASIGATQTDGDNDGLSDWEESIYGTNPGNPDSDGDGYLDGEEIISSRDPLKKGPYDLVVKTKNSTTPEGKNATEKFNILVVNNYLKTFNEQGLNNITQEQVSAAIFQSFNSETSSSEFNEIIKSELYYFIPPELDKELKIKENSEKNKNEYRENIAKFLLQMKDTAPSGDFIQTIKESMQAKNYGNLYNFINFYKDSYKKVASISVPQMYVTNQKNLLSTLYKLQKIGEAVKNYDKDPIKSLLALNELTKTVQQVQEAFKK